MAVIDELIREEENGSISFGNYELDTKTKKDGFEYKRINWKRATHRNPPLTQSAKRPKLRDTFFAELEQNGYEHKEKKHMTTGKAVVKKAARIMKNKIKGGH